MGAVKVNPDGSITVASLQDALDLQGLILARQQEAKPRLRKKGASVAKHINGERPSEKIIRALKPVSGKEISSEQLAKLLGLGSTAGLGPKVRHLATSFEKDGLSLTDYLESEIRERRGPRIWMVK